MYFDLLKLIHIKLWSFNFQISDTDNEFTLTFENADSPKLFIALNWDLLDSYYGIGSSFTTSELNNLFAGWQRHCFTWKRYGYFKVS